MQGARFEGRRVIDDDVVVRGLEDSVVDDELQLRDKTFGREGGFISNKSSYSDYDYDTAAEKELQAEELQKPHPGHGHKERHARDKAMEESSSFRCMANCQKFRNFSMYFILSHLAGRGCVAFMGVNIVIQIVMIVIGIIFFNDCPLEGRLTMWNITTGVAFSFKMFTAMMFLAVMRKDIHLTGGVPEKTTIYKSPRYFCLCGLADCFLLALLIMGMTLTMPHIDCVIHRLEKEPEIDCKSDERCDYFPFFFTVAAMAFLETVYAIGYLVSIWISGCFYTMGVGEEAAGKIIRGYSKLKNRSSWNIKADEQKTLRRRSEKHEEKKKKKNKIKRKRRLGRRR